MSYFYDGMGLNIKEKANLDFSFYQGTTSEGKFRTTAKCTISCWSFPEELWDYFFEKYNNGNYNTDFRMEITAQCTCSDNDKVDKELGKRIARKKLLSKYFVILDNLTSEAVAAETVKLDKLLKYLRELRFIRIRTANKLSKLYCGE